MNTLNTSPDAHATKSRIMESAISVFSDKGFQKATVSEICDAAGANIASVNYYFGNKSKLYEAVLRYTFKEAQREFPSDGNFLENASPEIKLEAFITALIQRAFCPSSAGAFPKFIVHEMTNPTNLLESVMYELMHIEINVLKAILKPLLPDNISLQRRRFFGFNIMGIVMFFSFNKPAREKMMSSRHMTADQVKYLTRHITLFVLAGLKSASTELEDSIDISTHGKDEINES